MLLTLVYLLLLVYFCLFTFMFVCLLELFVVLFIHHSNDSHGYLSIIYLKRSQRR